MPIDIVEIWFGIANGQISSISICYLPMTDPYFRFKTISGVNPDGFSPNLICALIWSGIANGQISSLIDKVICPRHDNGGVLSCHVLFTFLLAFRKRAYSSI